MENYVQESNSPLKFSLPLSGKAPPPHFNLEIFQPPFLKFRLESQKTGGGTMFKEAWNGQFVDIIRFAIMLIKKTLDSIKVKKDGNFLAPPPHP